MSNTHVQVIHADGWREFIAPETAINYLRSGAADHDGQMTIRMKPPKGGSLRGPSCSVQGGVRGKGSDGRPKLSYVQNLAIGLRVRAMANEINSEGVVVVAEGETLVDYGLELSEIGRVHHRILLSVMKRDGAPAAHGGAAGKSLPRCSF
jgi:hypothetical protein